MLAGLPVLYYLLRVTPPNPNRVRFPPLRLILDLQPQDETAARTPWWLLLLRLAMAAAIILAMAGPVLNPLPAGGGGKAPLLVVIDDGWAGRHPGTRGRPRRLSGSRPRAGMASLLRSRRCLMRGVRWFYG